MAASTAAAIALLAAGSASAGESYSYDALGRLVSVTYSNGTVVRYNYDPAGNRTSITTSVGNAIWGSFTWGASNWG